MVKVLTAVSRNGHRPLNALAINSDDADRHQYGIFTLLKADKRVNVLNIRETPGAEYHLIGFETFRMAEIYSERCPADIEKAAQSRLSPVEPYAHAVKELEECPDKTVLVTFRLLRQKETAFSELRSRFFTLRIKLPHREKCP